VFSGQKTRASKTHCQPYFFQLSQVSSSVGASQLDKKTAQINIEMGECMEIESEDFSVADRC